MSEFKKGDKVTIVGNETWIIGGLYNHQSELYIIESNKCFYLFTNDYNEMKKDS